MDNGGGGGELTGLATLGYLLDKEPRVDYDVTPVRCYCTLSLSELPQTSEWSYRTEPPLVTGKWKEDSTLF